MAGAGLGVRSCRCRCPCRRSGWQTHAPELALQAVEAPLKFAQTAAVLEVLHSAVGLVRSPVFITGAALSHHTSLPAAILGALQDSSCLMPVKAPLRF